MTLTEQQIPRIGWRAFLLLLLAVVCAPAAFSQGQKVDAPKVPSRFRHAMEAQGNRYKQKGMERVVLSGTLAPGSGSAKRVQVVRDINGRFHMDWRGGPTGAFGGTTERVGGGALSASNKGEVEPLVRDTPEEFFAAIADGAALRLIGRRMRGDDGTTPNYQGPWYDVFELAEGPSRLRACAPSRKFFYFDSETSELVLVRYNDGPSQVRTVLSDWRTVGGEKVPGKVERMVNGRTEFTFQVDQIGFAADADDSFFRGVN